MKHESQTDRILELLQRAASSPLYNPEGWVTLPQIMSLHIASHSRRISDLRERGIEIEIRKEYEGRQLRTAYRLIRGII